MMLSGFSLHTRSMVAFYALVALSVTGTSARAETVPSSSAIPVVFTRTVEAGKAKPGEIVTTKTMQDVLLPGGKVLRRGSTLIGHVVESRPFVFSSTPYAVQTPSALSIHFGQILENGRVIPVSLSVRALSSFGATHEASTSYYADETDWAGTRVLVGGDRYYGLNEQVVSNDGKVVGYVRKQGVFARLLPNDSSSFHCDGTDTEQSVGIFSASACGLYGFSTSYMPENGRKKDGTFTLESQQRTVKLYGQSAALLQVIESK